MHYLKAPTFGRTQPRTIPSYHLDGMSAEGKLLLRGVAHPVGGAVVGVARTGDGLIVYQQRYVGLGEVGLLIGYGSGYDGCAVGCARAWGGRRLVMVGAVLVEAVIGCQSGKMSLVAWVVSRVWLEPSEFMV
jgi:hypothetical protein